MLEEEEPMIMLEVSILKIQVLRQISLVNIIKCAIASMLMKISDRSFAFLILDALKLIIN